MNGAAIRSRRFATAAIALILSAVFFRSQVADALVVRGDDFMYRSDVDAASARYERALRIDPANGVAADRVVFSEMERRSRTSIRRAIQTGEAYLLRVPRDPQVLADLALCRLVERRYDLAAADFERAAQYAGDPRYLLFAGWAEKRNRHLQKARRLWQRALLLDPRFRPAAAALAQVR